MKSPIDSLKKTYGSLREHLDAITQAIAKEFSISEAEHAQVKKAVVAAFDLGHKTITTDDWCDIF